MRVFDTYTFNIADKVKFKDTKKYLDRMLAELGLNFKEVAFTFKRFMTSIDQLVEKYPNLEKYRYPYFQFNGEEILTSLTPEWLDGELYAGKEDWDAIFEIASKVPRGYNVQPTIKMDQIDWYGEGAKEPAITPQQFYVGNALLCSHSPVDNSGIEMIREYDHGNKYNMVRVTVEATKGDGSAAEQPRDTADILAKLTPYLGMPTYTVRVCRFKPEEHRLYETYQAECGRLLIDRLQQAYQKEKDAYRGEDWRDVLNKPFVPNLADKKKLKAAFKGTDFVMGDRKGLLPGMNRVVCIDQHNFRFEVMTDRTQSSPDYFYFYFEISGYNFHIRSMQNTVYASSEEEAVEKLSELAAFCVRLKDEFGELLAEKFGDTPGWYRYE